MKKFLIFSALPLALAALPLQANAADLNAEIVTAATHADLATQSSDVAMVHMHLHHTLNCLVGPNGTDFDAKEINPCANSGNGAIPDTTDAAKQKSLEAAAGKARDGIAANNLTAAQKLAADTSAMLKAIK